MKMLTMDTSTLAMGVAVLDVEANQVLGEVSTQLHKNHSVRLMPSIEQLLRDLDLTIQEIGLLAVTSGPGSYTGIRIGVTTAKTISWARNIPLYSASSLAVLAMNGFRFDGLIVPMWDARRRRAYTGAFQWAGEQLEEALPQQVAEIDRWLEQLAEQKRPILFLGEVLYKEQIRERLGERAHFGTAAENIPRASQLGLLAAGKWRNQEPAEMMQFAPNYLQVTEAEANWAKQQGGIGDGGTT